MSRPKDPGAAIDPETGGTETEMADDVEHAETFSPLDAQVEAPINAAVHFDEEQGADGD